MAWLISGGALPSTRQENMDLLKAGKRATKPRRDANGPMHPLDHAGFGETIISPDQMAAIAQLYSTNPSLQAARVILLGQLLSSGIVIRRGGKDVELKDTFSKHLESHWLPFARSVADSFLMYGFSVVSIEEEDPLPFEGRAAKRPRPTQKLSSQTPPASTSGPIGTVDKKANLIPVVAEIGTYELSFVMGGRGGYKREYRTSCLSANQSYAVDDNLGLFIRNAPDGNGNINSPVATCFDSAAFVAALQELALQAEVVRARQLIVTQPVQKQGVGSGALDAASLFFDSESRAIQSQDQAATGADQAESLSLMARMCDTINQLRTTQLPDKPTGRGPALYIPPELPPNLFTVPDKHQVVPSLRAPEARSDLEALLRLSNDSICAAMGVPASIIVHSLYSYRLLKTSTIQPLPLRPPAVRGKV